MVGIHFTALSNTVWYSNSHERTSLAIASNSLLPLGTFLFTLFFAKTQFDSKKKLFTPIKLKLSKFKT